MLLPAPDARVPRCESVQIDTQRAIPTVWFVVDGSGSMLEPLSASDSTSRWEALRTTLLDEQNGVVKTLQERARFGLLTYDGPLLGADVMTPSGPTLECPRLVAINPQLDNFEGWVEGYPSEPLGGSTPTDKALDALIEQLDTASTAEQTGPTIVILATDGQPNDFCANDPNVPAVDVRGDVIARAKQIADAGHNVSVISLAGDDTELTQHLNAVAGATGTGKTAFTPRNRAELESTIHDLVGYDIVPCEVLLTDKIAPGKECDLTVELNGAALACNDPNGWRVVSEGDTSKIELTAGACEAYLQDVKSIIHVEYSCEIIL